MDPSPGPLQILGWIFYLYRALKQKQFPFVSVHSLYHHFIRASRTSLFNTFPVRANEGDKSLHLVRETLPRVISTRFWKLIDNFFNWDEFNFRWLKIKHYLDSNDSSISILMALGLNHLKWNHPKLTSLIRNSCSTVLFWRPPSRFRSLFVTISGFLAACLSSRVFFFFAGDSDVLYDWFSEIVQ